MVPTHVLEVISPTLLVLITLWKGPAFVCPSIGNQISLTLMTIGASPVHVLYIYVVSSTSRVQLSSCQRDTTVCNVTGGRRTEQTIRQLDMSAA